MFPIHCAHSLEVIFYDTFSILLFQLWPDSCVQVWHFPCTAWCWSSEKSKFLSISHFWSSDLDGSLLLHCLLGVPSECTVYCLLDSLVYYRPRMASEVEVPEAQRSKDLVIDHLLCPGWVRVESAYALCTVSQRIELIEAPPSMLDH